MSNQKLKKLVKILTSITIIVVTLGVFVWYIVTHPQVIQTILSLSPFTLALLTLGYAATILINGFVLSHSLRILKKNVSLAENTVLTGYSSIVNFFGPLQSGPGFRALYLKKLHGVKIREFLFISLIFYVFFAFINGIVVGIALISRFSWLSLLIVLTGIAVLSLTMILVYKKKRTSVSRLVSYVRQPSFWHIGIGALFLILATVFIYHSEISAIYGKVSIFQTIIYTATANLALFVSITPGALGIRESFLVLSEQLHHIPTSVVISASIIDRAFYVVFLLIMFVLLLVFNARKRFHFSSVIERESTT